MGRPFEHTSSSRGVFLGTAVATVLAIGASLAGPAGAGTLMTQDSQYPAALHAASTETEFPTANQFDPTDGGGLLVSCSTTTMTGTLGWARTTPALHPELSGCKSGATGFSATITTTGCDFRLHIGATIGETGRYDGAASIECEAGKAITIVADNCEIKIDSQAARSTVEFSNVAGSPGHVNFKWSLSGIVYTVLKDGILCQLNGTGTRETGDFKSTATLSATKSSGEALGLTIEDSDRTATEEEHLEGHQEATEEEAETEHEAQTAEEAKTAHEAETAFEEEGMNGGMLMTQGSKYPAALHSASTESEFPAANKFAPTDGGEFFVSCSALTMTGTLGWARATPALHPEFSGCKSGATGFGASITTTGCDLRLHIGATVGETGRYDGTASIECETGKAIKITGDNCEIQIDPQAARSTIELSNLAGSPEHVKVTWSLSGIVFTTVKDPPVGCRLNGVGTKETGDLTSTATLAAKDAGGKALGLTVEMP